MNILKTLVVGFILAFIFWPWGMLCYEVFIWLTTGRENLTLARGTVLTLWPVAAVVIVGVLVTIIEQMDFERKKKKEGR